MAPSLPRIVVALTPLVTAFALDGEPQPEDLFREFMEKFEREYENPEEKAARFEVFSHNLKHIRHMQDVEEGTAVYSHLTPFADLTPEEFSQRHGFRPELGQPSRDRPETLDTSALPTDFDWREKGAVNPVKNQKSCGSCWAFATVANIEGAGFVANKRLVSLSEQELVDCDTKTGDQGCKGGLPSNAFQDMVQSKLGLETEQNYPYVGRDDKCQATKSKEIVFISGFQQISQDEDQIAAALIKYGPLAIGINAGPMQWYMGGIAKPWKFLCNPTKLDHGVAIVGFGEQNGNKYWTIRNSWGGWWGEKGYYRIIRGTGACGLNTDVTTATGVTIQSPAESDVVV